MTTMTAGGTVVGLSTCPFGNRVTKTVNGVATLYLVRRLSPVA